MSTSECLRRRFLRLDIGCGLPFLMLTMLVAVGCGGGSPQTVPIQVDPTRQQLERLGTAYLLTTARLNRPPAKLDELLPALKPLGPTEQTLRSLNDGQEFVIVWGVELRQMKAEGNNVPVVAFEKTGKQGQRYVLRGRDIVLQMGDAELRGSTFPAGYKLPF